MDRPQALLRTSEAARLLGVSPNTLRSWEYRYGAALTERTVGGHRLWPRELLLGLRQAMIREGLGPGAAIPRAQQLVASGVLRDPPTLVERMGLVEAALDRLTLAVERLAVDVTDAILEHASHPRAEPRLDGVQEEGERPT